MTAERPFVRRRPHFHSLITISCQFPPARLLLSKYFMYWPTIPMEQQDRRRFRPPFCPWPQCRNHHPTPRRLFRFHRHGVFLRPFDRRPVPRFRCLSCLRTFSLQSFAFSYYLKLPQLSAPIAAMALNESKHTSYSVLPSENDFAAVSCPLSATSAFFLIIPISYSLGVATKSCQTGPASIMLTSGPAAFRISR